MKPSASIGRLLALVGLIVVVPPARADDWSSFGRDLARSRRTTEKIGPAFDAGGWRFQVPPPKDDVSIDLSGTPAVADGFVVFATMEGTLRALRAHDGQELWRFSARDGIAASPTIHRGRVTFGAFDRTLYSVRLSDGAAVWTREGMGIQYTAPTLVSDESGDGLLIVTGFPERRVLRLDAATGKTVWQTPDGAIEQSSNASIAVGGGLAIVSLAGGTYHAYDARTGQPAWTYRAPGTVHMASPLVVGDHVFLAPGGPKAEMHAVALGTGTSIEGWPVAITIAQPATGKLLERQSIVSSPSLSAGLVLLQVRFADFVDTGTDGLPDRYDLREMLVAVDPTTGKLTYQVELASASSPSPTIIPTLGILPTPASYVDTASGDDLIAVAVSMQPVVRVLRARTGAGLWQRALPAATKSSPVVANALLFIGADRGTLHALASGTNHAPLAPDLTSSPVRTLSAFFPRLPMVPAMDPDGDVLGYQVRIDRDREVIESWELQLDVSPGATEARLPASLVDGATYGYAVRARDASGAWSAWSTVATFQVTTPDGIAINGRGLTSLAQALALAKPGDIVSIGAGRFSLGATARVRAGVSLVGAGPGRTTLDAGSVGVGISVEGSADRAGRLSRMTIAGGDVGVDVADGQHASLQNVIVRDARAVGVRVGAAGSAQLSFGTIVRNNTGLYSRGRMTVRNTLVLDNEIGVVVASDAAWDSRFNDVARNRIDLQGAARSPDDLAALVSFTDAARDDFHLLPGQPTTDKGDPAGEFADEPAPNGGRANLGAYGATPEAELSVIQGPDEMPDDRKPVTTKTSRGCAMGGGGGHGLPFLFVALALLRRRSRRTR